MVIAAGERSRDEAAVLASTLRRAHAVEVDLFGRSVSSQMKSADRLQALIALVIGDEELDGNFVTLKNMSSGSQERVDRPALESRLRDILDGSSSGGETR
jgi:histidyl-tRNA synthetase